jgi:hypothetical protein
MKSGEGRESTYANRIRAIQQMTISDGRVLADNQFWTPIRLVREVMR